MPRDAYSDIEGLNESRRRRPRRTDDGESEEAKSLSAVLLLAAAARRRRRRYRGIGLSETRELRFFFDETD